MLTSFTSRLRGRRLVAIACGAAVALAAGAGSASAAKPAPPATADTTLYLAGPAASPALDSNNAPTADGFRDSASLNAAGGNRWVSAGTWTDMSLGVIESVSALGDLHAFLGVPTVADQGVKFDLRADVYAGDTLVASSISRCQNGLTRNQPKETVISFPAFATVQTKTAGPIELVLSTRIGTNADDSLCENGKTSTTASALRVYFGGPSTKQVGGTQSFFTITAAKLAPPVIVGQPSITGDLVPGATLTVLSATVIGDQVSTVFTWERCLNGSCASVGTGSSYKLSVADAGATFEVVQTATNPAGSATATSLPTAPVMKPPALVTAPVIGGDVHEGETLTAKDAVFSGDQLTIAGQWQRCKDGVCTDIVGASSSSYTLTGADAGFTIRFVQTATNPAGSASGSDTSATILKKIVAPYLIDAPNLNDLHHVGDTLTATAAVFGGDEPMTVTRVWQRCTTDGVCVDIAGASGLTYTLTDADAGSLIRVVETATNPAGSATGSVTTSTAVKKLVAPYVISEPEIGGGNFVGDTLTGTHAVFGGDEPMTITRIWQRCKSGSCVDMTTPIDQYTLTEDDLGATFRMVETARNTAGSATAISEQTLVCQKKVIPPTITRPPVATRQGNTITVAAATFDGDPTSTAVSTQWERCKSGVCLAVGDGSNSYQVTAADAGATIIVVQTISNSAGQVETTSAPIYVPQLAPTVVSAPSISTTTATTVTVGDRIIATPADFTGDGLTINSKWKRCKQTTCQDIVGADDQLAYQLADADAGYQIEFEQTATNESGSMTVDSPATAVVSPRVIAPLVVQAPVISGDAVVGSTLTATAGTFSDSQARVASVWKACASGTCTSISGASGTSYTLTAAEAGKTVEFEQTATNTAGSATATSQPTAVVSAPPVAPAPTYNQAVLADSPVSFWSLSEAGTSVSDSAAAGNTGAWTGTHTTTAGPTKDSTASMFGGSSYVTTGQSVQFDNSNLTVEGWFKTTYTGTQQQIWYSGSGPQNLEVFVGGGPNPYNGRTAPAGSLNFYAYDANSAEHDVWVFTTTNVADGSWHHFAAVRNGGSWKLYLDGQDVGSGGGDSWAPFGTFALNDVDTAGAPTRIGEFQNNDYFGGSLADIAIYKTALTGTQVAKHYAAR